MSTEETILDKTGKAVERRAGFNDKGEPYPGVDPKTGERVTAFLGDLKKEFGDKLGETKFRQIGQLTGTIDALTSLEQQAAVAGGIQLQGLPKDVQFKVNEILTAKE